MVERPAAITGIGCLTGIARWKRKRVRAMLGGPPVRDSADAAVRLAARRGGAVACWASRVPDGLPARAANAGVPVWWIEDGFLRSVGLGAALVQPASLTIDTRRPHYDPRETSDLEMLLQSAEFSRAETDRAARLINAITAAAITKYNLGGAPVGLPAGRRIVLVPGQVELDRSVLLGGGGVSMADLLERVRALEPDAYVLYKPHPDVASGLRGGALREPEALRFADKLVPDADLIALLDRVDVVHTLTSQTGLEALLRGREVVVHGQPFYAGWGLTRDLAPVPRRTRKRAIEELVAAALIAYPVYADPVRGTPATPEQVVAGLARQPAAKPLGVQPIAARIAAWHARLRERSDRREQGRR